MGKVALTGLIVLNLASPGSVSAPQPGQVPAPKPVVCVPNQPALAAPFEAAVAADPQSIPRQIDLGRCYDTAWRFGDAERTILRTLELVRKEFEQITRVTPEPGAPVAVGDDIPFPDRTCDNRAEYPADAARDNVQGVVVVEAIVDGRGRVRRTRIVESIPKLDLTAGDAVRRWQFAPTVVQGKPVDVVMYFFVRFGLPRDLMPADWLDMARFYYGQRLFQQAITPIEAALARVRRDRERFAEGATVKYPEKVAEPTVLRKVPPLYPPAALAFMAEGTVVVDAMIDRFGDVGRARIAKSVPIFDAAAIDGVLQWGYTPVMVNGSPVTAQLLVTVNFRLR